MHIELYKFDMRVCKYVSVYLQIDSEKKCKVRENLWRLVSRHVQYDVWRFKNKYREIWAGRVFVYCKNWKEEYFPLIFLNI